MKVHWRAHCLHICILCQHCAVHQWHWAECIHFQCTMADIFCIFGLLLRVAGYCSNISWTTIERISRGLSFYSWYVAATTVMKPFSFEKGLNTVRQKAHPAVKEKRLKFLWVVRAQPWQCSPLLVCMCPWRSFSVLSTCMQHKVRKEKYTWWCEKGNMLLTVKIQ